MSDRSAPENDPRRPEWQREAMRREKGPRFMDMPDRWMEDVTRFRCPNNHVSRCILKSEERGDLCLKCTAPVNMTFPEDIDGPINLDAIPATLADAQFVALRCLVCNVRTEADDADGQLNVLCPDCHVPMRRIESEPSPRGREQ